MQNQKQQAPRKTRPKIGRRTVITPKVETALIVAFEAGASIREAAALAGVSRTAVCNYLSTVPEIKGEIHTLQAKPTACAKVLISDALRNGDVEVAKWFLGREAKRTIERERARLSRAQRKALETVKGPLSIVPAVFDIPAILAQLDEDTVGEKSENENDSSLPSE